MGRIQVDGEGVTGANVGPIHSQWLTIRGARLPLAHGIRRLLFDTSVPLWRYCLVAFAIATIPSMVLSASAYAIWRAFGLNAETLILAGGLGSLSSFSNHKVLVVGASIIAWGCLHALFGTLWFFGTVWSFFAFSLAYLIGREHGFFRAFIAAAVPHALVNLTVFVGIAAKRRDSRYEPGQRSGAWQKMRVNQGQEFMIAGYTPSARSFDALIFGCYEGDQLTYVAGPATASLRHHARSCSRDSAGWRDCTVPVFCRSTGSKIGMGWAPTVRRYVQHANGNSRAVMTRTHHNLWMIPVSVADDKDPDAVLPGWPRQSGVPESTRRLPCVVQNMSMV